MSEVRCSLEQQVSVARRAKRLGYSMEFSTPPGPSPNFRVSPGGTAIAARAPLVIRMLEPQVLSKWMDMGRLVACQLISFSCSFLVVSLYGIPIGHPLKSANDWLLADTVCWSASMNMPTLIGGDLNETPYTSLTLSSLHLWGFARLNDNRPTTKGRSSHTSKGLPLDHVVANMKMMDHHPLAAVAYDRTLSDHYGIEGSFRVPEVTFGVRRWPPPMDLSWGIVEAPPWQGECCTFAEWCAKAASWLSRAFRVPCVNKNACHVDPYRPPSPKSDLIFDSINAAKRALQHARIAKKITQSQLSSLSRKLFALGIQSLDWNDADAQLDKILNEHIESLSRNAIKRRKERVSFWTLQSRDLYAFIKNVPAVKASALQTPEGVTADPLEIHSALTRFWGHLEAWPSEEHRQYALFRLSDHYCVFLPSYKAEVVSDWKVLAIIVREARRTSPGPDGWTIEELKALPKAAWRSLLEVLQKGWQHFASTLLLTYKRVPIEKGCTGVPLPSDMRPLDVYSAIMRAIARMHTTSIMSWKKMVIHEGRYSSHGGTGPALARLTCVVERVRRKIGKWWCLTVDFTKLYNMIDAVVVQQILIFVGLSERSAAQLMEPIILSRGYWRLPHGADGKHYAHDRGVPQGLSTSVLASEAFVSILCWKITRCTSTQVIGYVDDITLASDDLADFRIPWEFWVPSSLMSASLLTLSSPAYGGLMKNPFEYWHRRLGILWSPRFQL